MFLRILPPFLLYLLVHSLAPSHENLLSLALDAYPPLNPPFLSSLESNEESEKRRYPLR